MQRPLERRVAELDKLIESAAGGPFDVASPKDVREVLFGRLRLPVAGLRHEARPQTPLHRPRGMSSFPLPVPYVLAHENAGNGRHQVMKALSKTCWQCHASPSAMCIVRADITQSLYGECSEPSATRAGFAA